MRSLSVCLLCLFAPAVLAGEISADYRGVWTESGQCPQPKRIVVSDKAVTLVKPGVTRLLTDGDEAVFNGETIINASLPAHKEKDPVLAFSAKVVERDGELTLVTTGLEESKAFAGTFKRCKGDLRSAAAHAAPAAAPAAVAKPKAPKKKVAVQRAPAPSGYYYYAPGPMLGGLY